MATKKDEFKQVPQFIVRRRLVRPRIERGGRVMTKQAFKDECDINNILKKFQNLNASPYIKPDLSLFRDVSNVPVYKEGVQIVEDANDQFMQLPSSIRKRFNNDPFQLLEFLSDKSNFDEASRLGLLKPQEPQGNEPEPKGTSAGQEAGKPASGQSSAK